MQGACEGRLPCPRAGSILHSGLHKKQLLAKQISPWSEEFTNADLGCSRASQSSLRGTCIRQYTMADRESPDILLAVRDSKGVIVGDLSLIHPVGDLVLVVILDVSMQLMGIVARRSRAASLLSAFVEIRIANRGCGKALKDQEPGETEGPLETSLEYGRIDTTAFQFWPIDLEVAVAVLGQPVLVGRASAGEIDVIDLGDETAQSPGGYPDLLAIVSPACSIDVESGQDLWLLNMFLARSRTSRMTEKEAKTRLTSPIDLYTRKTI